MRVSGDVDRLHVREGREHHLDLDRLEDAAVFLVVAILDLDIGLRKEAEDLGQQVALVVGQLLRPVAAILAQWHFLGHPVDLLLTLPEVERPRVFERFVLIADFEKGHGSAFHSGEMTNVVGRDGAAHGQNTRFGWLSRCERRRYISIYIHSPEKAKNSKAKPLAIESAVPTGPNSSPA